MAGSRLKGFVALTAAGAMLVSPALASAEAMPAGQTISPWATLTALSGGAPAAAVCGAAAAAAAAAQPAGGCVLPVVDVTPVAAAPPPPLPAVAEGGYGISPLLLGLVAIAGAAAIFFAVKGHGHHQANSPG